MSRMKGELWECDCCHKKIFREYVQLKQEPFHTMPEGWEKYPWGEAKHRIMAADGAVLCESCYKKIRNSADVAMAMTYASTELEIITTDQERERTAQHEPET